MNRFSKENWYRYSQDISQVVEKFHIENILEFLFPSMSGIPEMYPDIEGENREKLFDILEGLIKKEIFEYFSKNPKLLQNYISQEQDGMSSVDEDGKWVQYYHLEEHFYVSHLVEHRVAEILSDKWKSNDPSLNPVKEILINTIISDVKDHKHLDPRYEEFAEKALGHNFEELYEQFHGQKPSFNNDVEEDE